MKKIIFILLLCFALAFVALAVPMSPHPGDTLETVFTVQDDIVISQAAPAPANDMLYLEQFNNYEAVGAAAYISSEMENDILYNTIEDVDIYHTEYG